jgi:hypothetical protein
VSRSRSFYIYTSECNLYFSVKESAEVPRNDDDWFSTPRDTLQNSSPLTIDPGNSKRTFSPPADTTPSPCEVEGPHSHVSQPPSTAHTGLTTVEPHAHQTLSNGDTLLVPPDPPKQALPLTKKQMKKLKKAQRQREIAASSSTTIPVPPPAASVPSAEPIRDERLQQTSSSSLPPPPPPSVSPKHDAASGQLEAPTTPEPPSVPCLNAGLVTETVRCLISTLNQYLKHVVATLGYISSFGNIRTGQDSEPHRRNHIHHFTLFHKKWR